MTTTRTLIFGAALALVFGCDSGDGGNTDNADNTDNAGTGDGDGIPTEYAGQENPVANDATAIDAGAMTFAGQCASCHGEGGAGDGTSASGLIPAPTNFTSQTGQADDFMLWTISDGVAGTGMPGYKSQLSRDEIWQVVSFIRTLQ